MHVLTTFSHLKSQFLQNINNLTKLRVTYCVYKTSGSSLQIFPTPNIPYFVFSFPTALFFLIPPLPLDKEIYFEVQLG